MYKQVLSTEQIKSLYDQGAPDKLNAGISQPQGKGRLESGLGAYFPLDENTGTSATDTSTNGNNGTLTNGPTWTTGQIGTAVDFDGSDDYITVTDPDVLDVADTRNFSLTGWFNRDTFTTDDTIIAKRNGITASDTGYIVYIDDATDKLTFEVSDGTNEYQVESASTFTATGWHHFSIIFNDTSASLIKMYIDGISETTTKTSILAAVTSMANSVDFRIGAESDAGNPFDGKLDEIRFYNRTLSDEEAVQLYRLTSPTGTDTGIKGYWPFNGGDTTATLAMDRSGAGNIGTLTNSPTKKAGKIGQGIDFDGTDDYVSVPDNASLDIGDTDDLTITGWFNRDTFTTDDTILAKRNGVSTSDQGYIAYIDDSTDKLTFENCDASSGCDEYQLESTSTFTAAGWHHFAIVWDQDSASGSEIYIDGVADSATDTGTIGNIGDLSNSVVLAIGAESDAGNPFDGKLDEIRVYKRALTSSEIAALYNQSR